MCRGEVVGWLSVGRKRFNSNLRAPFYAESGRIVTGRWGGIGEVPRRGWGVGRAFGNQMGRAALDRD